MPHDDSCQHEHGLSIGHVHAPANYNRIFAFGVILNVVFVTVEAGFGIAVNSLSLLADAGHNLGDVLGLLLAWGAYHLTALKPTSRRTYGWRSTSILAALVNSLLLMATIGGITWEAVGRFRHPAEVAGGTVMIVAGIGVVINTATALLFMRGRHSDLNIRGAFLHMAADAAVSVAVVAGGLGIWFGGWLWLDPALSLLIVAVIFFSTWSLLKESLNLALQAVPSNIDPGEVKQLLASQPGVTEVHDLHIWAMSTTEVALTAHLVMPELIATDSDAVLHEMSDSLRDQFGIGHATLQIERESGSFNCRQANPDVV